MPGLESTEWPASGTTIRVLVRDDPREYPSRVHEGDGPTLLVAAPRKLAVSQPAPGDTIHLSWGAKYGARMCRTRLVGHRGPSDARVAPRGARDAGRGATAPPRPHPRRSRRS